MISRLFAFHIADMRVLGVKMHNSECVFSPKEWLLSLGKNIPLNLGIFKVKDVGKVLL